MARRLAVLPIPALEDNFMYLFFDRETKRGGCVDPVEPSKIQEAAVREGVEVEAALVTHHHWDHAGGNANFVSLFPNRRVLGGDERIEKMTEHVKHLQKTTVGGIEVTSLCTPSHTRGHICYFLQLGGEGVVFTGDTLFIAGCGKFFEGDGTQMHSNLNTILGGLPDDTLVYPGHEYTTSNLKFAAHVEPNNQTIKDKLAWSIRMNKEGTATVPSTIGEEKNINPFMRVVHPSVQEFAKQTDPVAVMSTLRDKKNNFKAN